MRAFRVKVAPLGVAPSGPSRPTRAGGTTPGTAAAKAISSSPSSVEGARPTGLVSPSPTARMSAPMPRPTHRPSPPRPLVAVLAAALAPALLAASSGAQDADLPDQVFTRNPRTGAISAVTGQVTSEGQNDVLLESGSKETKVPAERVVRIEWGSVPPSFSEGLKYFERGLFEDATAKFRLAAGDASAREVVQADAQLRAADSLLAWGAADPARFNEAALAAAAFVEAHPEHRRRGQAEMTRARALVLAGKGTEGIEVYRGVFAQLSGTEAAAGYAPPTCLRAGLLAARAALRAGDTLAARELFTSLASGSAAVLAALEDDDPARPELAAIQGEAQLGEGFAELAGGNSKAALTFFESKLGSMNGSATPAVRSAAALGLGEALLAEGEARRAELELARVSALDYTDRDRAARAHVLLARCAQKLLDKDFKQSSCTWLEAVVEHYGDTPSAAEARELIEKLGC